MKRLADLDGPRRELVDRVSLYRAYHTAGLVLADRTDDSHGNVGEVRTLAWERYLSLDWRTAGIEPAALATDHVGGFVEAARALGSRSWMPIVHMAEHALDGGDRRIAVAVFDAADQAGFHQRTLADRRLKLHV